MIFTGGVFGGSFPDISEGKLTDIKNIFVPDLQDTFTGYNQSTDTATENFRIRKADKG